MASNLQYYKTTTGQKASSIVMDTTGIGAPVNTASTVYTTSTEKATVMIGPAVNAFICDPGGANKTYNLGDTMISSDSMQIYNSAGAIMTGFLQADYPNWQSGYIQSIIITRVPDLVVDNAGFATDKRGKFFWCFFNQGATGVSTGVIDMDSNAGLGGFSNFTAIGESGCGGGNLGIVSGTEVGISTRMAAACYTADGEETGIILITHAFNFASATPNQRWLVNHLTAAEGSLCGPKISDLAACVTNTSIGTSLDGMNDDASHGTIAISPNLSTDTGNLKVATMINSYTGVFPVIVNQIKLDILTLDTATGVLSNAVTTYVGVYDRGPGIGQYPIQPRYLFKSSVILCSF